MSKKTYGFYTPDLAMNDVIVDDMLMVTYKNYDHIKDMMYWEFQRVGTLKD